MTNGAPLFDRRLLRIRRSRTASGIGGHDFLLRRVSEDFGTRLEAINRDFALAADLGAGHGVIAAELAKASRVGCIIHRDLGAAGPGLRLDIDEEMPPFADQSLDLIVSGLSLHTVNDLPGALVQIRRALRPDGLFLGALFAGDTLTELRQSLALAETELTGRAAPRVSPFADTRALGNLVHRAGFALSVADADRVTVRYSSIVGLMRDLRGMGEANVLLDRSRVPLRRDVLARAGEIYGTRFADSDGRVRATFDIVTLTGWAPHESQQKPLCPGSAKTRLADALETHEVSFGVKPKQPKSR